MSAVEAARGEGISEGRAETPNAWEELAERCIHWGGHAYLCPWRSRGDRLLLETVDVGDDTWTGPMGVVTTLCRQVIADPSRSIAYTCGPPIMIRSVMQELLATGIAEEQIASTPERYMKCGAGKCGRCAGGPKYVCVDSPVFTCRQVKGLPEPS